MVERYLFPHFFLGLALAGALAEWTLACWFLAPLGLTVPISVHVIVPLPLAVLNRLAARPLADVPSGPLARGTAHVVLAVAFGALVGVGVLGASAVAWTGAQLVGGLQAEAGVVVAGASVPWFGTGFRLLGSAAMAASSLALVYGYTYGHRRLVVSTIKLPVAGLPPALAGLRIVHLSDLHLGPLAERAALRDALRRVAALDPDIVCVTGDMVDTRATDLDSWVPELARVTARRGVFAILGNHDRHVGAERVCEALGRHTSWRILRDEVATIEVGGARLHLVGLEDRRASEAAAALPCLLQGLPAGEAVIVLAHRPIVFRDAAAAGVPLTLAGHTHGGQVAIPGAPHLNVARVMLTRFDAGCFAEGESLLYVSRGLGASGQRLRLGVPREISVLTLVARPARAA